MKWETRKLGELIHIKHGWAFKGEYFGNEGELIILTPGNFFEKGGFRQVAGKEKFYHGEFPEEFLLKKDDLVIAMTEQGPGLLGSPALVLGDDTYLHNQRTGLIKAIDKERISYKYLYYLFFTSIVRNEIFASATGTKVKHTAPKRIYDIQVPLPLLPTQRRIASILSAYDDLIENNLKRIKLLEEKAFLRYKEIVRGEKLEEFFIDEVCQTLGGGTPSTGNEQYWNDGNVLWFSPTDLTKHHSFVLLDSEKKISELGLQKSSAKLVPPKTILMTSRASIGYFGLINQAASTNQGFINIIPNKEYFRAYMLFDLKSRKDEIIGTANGSIFLEISKGKFRQMNIKLPVDENILVNFENEFDVTFNFIENLLMQNAKLREARDILLPRLMRGELVV
jgi:type I restriction enzyme S subunit